MKQPTQEVRDEVCERDKWRCVRCGIPLTNIHHRVPRSHPFKGLHKPANLIGLCGTGTTGCHGWVHDHPKESYEHGWLVHSWQDPEKIPVDVQGRMFYLKNSGERIAA